ncbi:hypothetical protein ACQP1O_33085 [Nocardia sp. CA-151230]|uniref:hypothetical protein n=1 Tax=Nocardia sp. CA-151230 TaxID=3239982 RepID=UPI003D932D17
MTKARLGDDSDDPERQLTKSLAPVREVMEAGDLDFNQLLQRDLDDHRVAVQLIPYLLSRKANGPAFFPPIVAVLLPFRHKKPSFFDPLGGLTIVEDDGARWEQEKAGTAFQVQRLVIGEDDSRHPASVGKLWWNRIESQLVVLDGQHRAMALLAVERTMTKSWQNSGVGMRFRSFYENQVNQVLKELGNEVDLGSIEVPVTVCWFPEQTGPDARPHEAARKLFVDVNKEARQPSDSRIILLSDAELSNVLTRQILNQVRNDSDRAMLPIYAIEYDNPENSARPARWSVLTNIHLLKTAVDRCIFGPGKYLSDVTQKISGGRYSPTQADALMRDQLDLTSLFPSEFSDGGFVYQRDKLGNKEFPLGQVEKIATRFADSWGLAILQLLSSVSPYAAHSKALTKLKEGWHVDDTGLSLAHDAMFGGVGVYWTLRDSYNHYKDEVANSNGVEIPKSDVILAWEALDRRREAFEVYRSMAYLDAGNAKTLERSKAAYSVFNTNACQLGMILAFASLWEMRKGQPGGVDIRDLPRFAESLTRAWNSYFDTETSPAKSRKLVFNRNVETPLNYIITMDTPQAVYFRYFWIQLLDVPEAWAHIESWFADKAGFKEMLGAARSLYLDLCSDQHLKALKTSRSNTSDAKLRPIANDLARRQLQKAMKKWFYENDQPYVEWLDQLSHSESSGSFDDDQISDDVEHSLRDDTNTEDGPAVSLEELLAE